MEYPIGLLIGVASILVFHGSVYMLVALNLGWRFGYWVTGASFFGLMFVMSAFWVVTALGPRGEEPHWVPVAAAQDTVSQATFEDATLTGFARYPTGDWQAPESEEDPHFDQLDEIRSAVGSCIAALPEALAALPSPQRETCTDAQGLLPAAAEIPVVEGMRIILTNEVDDIRFMSEQGHLLAQATVTPLTRDPRYVEDPDNPVPVADPFVVAAVHEPGDLRGPAMGYLIGSTLLLLAHLWGLSRAERKVLSPVVAL